MLSTLARRCLMAFILQGPHLLVRELPGLVVTVLLIVSSIPSTEKRLKNVKVK
jgi:hypothetical protein